MQQEVDKWEEEGIANSGQGKGHRKGSIPAGF
jgi:hypothetical protein